MTCNKCGNRLPDDSEFCQYCGSRIEIMEDPHTVEEMNPIPCEDGVVAPMSGETEKRPEEKDVPPMPMFGNDPQETVGTKDVDPQSQFDHERKVDFTPTPEKTPKEKKRKRTGKKYCSRCGALIDPQSKQCTGCGKQYFKGIKFNKVFVTITVLSLVIAALMGANVFQYLNYSQTEEELHKAQVKNENSELEVANLEKKIENLEESNLDYRKEVANLRTANNDHKTTITIQKKEIESLEYYKDFYSNYFDFCEEYVAVIGDDGTDIYHKYGCNRLDTSRGFWVVNNETAEYQGYTRCSHCH